MEFALEYPNQRQQQMEKVSVLRKEFRVFEGPGYDLPEGFDCTRVLLSGNVMNGDALQGFFKEQGYEVIAINIIDMEPGTALVTFARPKDAWDFTREDMCVSWDGTRIDEFTFFTNRPDWMRGKKWKPLEGKDWVSAEPAPDFRRSGNRWIIPTSSAFQSENSEAGASLKEESLRVSQAQLVFEPRVATTIDRVAQTETTWYEEGKGVMHWMVLRPCLATDKVLDRITMMGAPRLKGDFYSDIAEEYPRYKGDTAALRVSDDDDFPAGQGVPEMRVHDNIHSFLEEFFEKGYACIANGYETAVLGKTFYESFFKEQDADDAVLSPFKAPPSDNSTLTTDYDTDDDDKAEVTLFGGDGQFSYDEEDHDDEESISAWHVIDTQFGVAGMPHRDSWGERTVKDYFGQRKFTHAWQFFRAGNFPVDEEFGLNVWAPLHGEKRLLVVPKDSSEAANDPYDEFIEADVNQKVLENAVISPPGCTVIFHDNLIHCGIGAPLSEWGARSDVDRRFPGFVASTTRSSWSVYYDEQKGWRLMNSLREQWLTEERARELQKKAAATEKGGL